jgi:hypothetical protein
MSETRRQRSIRRKAERAFVVTMRNAIADISDEQLAQLKAIANDPSSLEQAYAKQLIERIRHPRETRRDRNRRDADITYDLRNRLAAHHHRSVETFITVDDMRALIAITEDSRSYEQVRAIGLLFDIVDRLDAEEMREAAKKHAALRMGDAMLAGAHSSSYTHAGARRRARTRAADISERERWLEAHRRKMAERDARDIRNSHSAVGPVNLSP